MVRCAGHVLIEAVDGVAEPDQQFLAVTAERVPTRRDRRDRSTSATKTQHQARESKPEPWVSTVTSIGSHVC
jgi:hypothetical protein